MKREPDSPGNPRDAKRQQIVDSLIRSFNADRPIVREVRFEDIAGGGDDADQA